MASVLLRSARVESRNWFAGNWRLFRGTKDDTSHHIGLDTTPSLIKFVEGGV